MDNLNFPPYSEANKFKLWSLDCAPIAYTSGKNQPLWMLSSEVSKSILFLGSQNKFYVCKSLIYVFFCGTYFQSYLELFERTVYGLVFHKYKLQVKHNLQEL